MMTAVTNLTTLVKIGGRRETIEDMLMTIQIRMKVTLVLVVMMLRRQKEVIPGITDIIGELTIHHLTILAVRMILLCEGKSVSDTTGPTIATCSLIDHVVLIHQTVITGGVMPEANPQGSHLMIIMKNQQY